MKNLSEHFYDGELTEYLQLQLVEEGAVADFFKKTFNYLKGKIAKIGDFFVSLFGDKPLPVMMPISSQAALKKGDVRDTAGVHWVGNSEDKKFSGVDTTGDKLLASRKSTIQMWKDAATAKGIKESKESLTFVEQEELDKLKETTAEHTAHTRLLVLA